MTVIRAAVLIFLLIILCAAAYRIIRHAISGDLEREKKWAEYEHRNNQTKR